MLKSITDADRELLDELGLDTATEQSSQRSAKEERIIAGFEEIERFVEEQGRLPEHGEKRDIFERLYAAVRLDRLRDSDECREILKQLDLRGLLDPETDTSLTTEEDLTDEALLASLGIDADSENDVTQLVHVRRQGLEALLQKFFSSARLDLELIDRFGTPVKPRERFLVTLEVIEEVIEKIKEGTIDQFRYDLKTVSLIRSQRHPREIAEMKTVMG